MSTESSNSNEATKKCPYCGRTVDAEATKCNNCGISLVEKPQALTNRLYYSSPPIKSSLGNNNANTGNNCIPHPEQLDILVPLYTSRHFTMPYIMMFVCAYWSMIMWNWGLSNYLKVLSWEVFCNLGESSFLLSFVLLIIAVVNCCVLLFRCWNIIQDGYARIPPVLAVLLFIPVFCIHWLFVVFNAYWLFVVFYGLSEDLNRYIQRYQLQVKPCSECIVLLFCVFFFLGPELNVLLGAFALYTIMRTARDIQAFKMEQMNLIKNR